MDRDSIRLECLKLLWAKSDGRDIPQVITDAKKLEAYVAQDAETVKPVKKSDNPKNLFK